MLAGNFTWLFYRTQFVSPAARRLSGRPGVLGYARGQYAATWSWKAVCLQYNKVPKAQAVLVALDPQSLQLTRNSDCDLSEFIHGFVGGHRGDENSAVPLAVANKSAAQTRNTYVRESC